MTEAIRSYMKETVKDWERRTGLKITLNKYHTCPTCETAYGKDVTGKECPYCHKGRNA